MAAYTLTLYGESLTWKTSEFAQIAMYLYAMTGKPVRWIATDLAGVEILNEFIVAGIVDFFPAILPNRPIHSLMRSLQRGSWGPPPSIRPDSSTRTQAMGSGRFVTNPQFQNDPWRDVLVSAGYGLDLPGYGQWTNDLSQVSGYIFEGPSTLGTLLLNDHTAANRKVAQDVVGNWLEYSMDGQSAMGNGVESFAQPGQSHYGNAQQFILNSVTQFTSLPVPFVGFSTHESKGADQVTKAISLGPKVVGNAATEALRPLLQDYFHIDIIKVPLLDQNRRQIGETPYRLAWFMNHPSELPGLHWPAGLRLNSMKIPGPRGEMLPSVMDQVLARWPGGYLNLTGLPGQPPDRIVHYVEFRQKILAAGAGNLSQWAASIRAQRAGGVGLVGGAGGAGGAGSTTAAGQAGPTGPTPALPEKPV